MKYLTECMSKNDAKKAFRALSKKLHPDVGGDADEFKILADEYATVLKGYVDYVQVGKDALERAQRICEELVSIFADMYPKTKIHLNYAMNFIEAELGENVPLKKMVHIESVVRKLAPGMEVCVVFTRNGSKKVYNLITIGNCTLINFKPGEGYSTDDTEVVYRGRRYKITKNKKCEFAVDSKEDHTYVLRKTTLFNMKELLDL